jgi:tRNA modification GTPase
MLSTTDERPIIALCTPKGSGAIALLRLSGESSIEIADKMAKLSSGKKFYKQKSHTIHHGRLINGNQTIDQVLFLIMKAPKTFTGQDTVEITCHNNPYIIEQIINRAIELGAHQAQRGEFSKRAVLNKKIDLLQAEALKDLVAAQTELALKKSMSQLHGTLSFEVKKIEEKLFSLLSTVEASFEFLEEEQRDLDFDDSIRKKVKEIVENTNKILKNFSFQKQIRNGIRIAIIGDVNVGKSTLFNALAKKDRAIVTEKPGTTRDAIETPLFKNGQFWSIVDTAGIRKTSDTIEKEGIKRSLDEADRADIVVLVLDATKPVSLDTPPLQQVASSALGTNGGYNPGRTDKRDNLITVVNKIDIMPASPKPPFVPSAIPISAKENIGIEKLEASLEEKIKNLFNTAQSPFLLNQRQHKIISELNIKMKQLEKKYPNRIQYELVAHVLGEALELVAQLTGKNINERVMGEIFKNFCVGK